jgi:hypothetical protein
VVWGFWPPQAGAKDFKVNEQSSDPGKSELDAAWRKIETGEQLEADGRVLWIEGTLELIAILDSARERLGPDQAFGAWLTDNGYGENRISRDDRSALLNMALHLDVTREVLEQTHRRSWQLIWREEVQSRLRRATQPADGNGPEDPGTEAPDNKEPKAPPTRRPKTKGVKQKTNGAQADEFAEDNRAAVNELFDHANAIRGIIKSVRTSAPERARGFLLAMEQHLLSQLPDTADDLVWIFDRHQQVLTEETEKADDLSKEGRVTNSPKPCS